MKPRMLDSDTLSFALKRREPTASRADRYIREHGGLVTSVITYYEVLRGLKYTNAMQLLTRFYRYVNTNLILPLDLKACEQAAEIYATLRSNGTLIPDADILIAAIALAHDCVLVTNNTQHYQRIPEVELENWAV
jgi:tRNA(fMet)-specific endonuclease VapC